MLSISITRRRYNENSDEKGKRYITSNKHINKGSNHDKNKYISRAKKLEVYNAVSYTHLDVYKRQVKLYPVNRATTIKVLGVITELCVPEIGKPTSIITDHGTQFKGKRWRDTLLLSLIHI